MKKSKRSYDMFSLYMGAYSRTVDEFSKQADEDTCMDFIKKLITYGVKIVNSKPIEKFTSMQIARNNFEFADSIQSLMGLLTPKQFESLFPIKKDFDGHKYECKDYFYTRKYIDNLEQDKPIGADKIPRLLWAYVNDELMDFSLEIMDYIDNIRRLNGEPSCIEEFFQKEGLKTYTMHEDEKGKKFIVDNETGKSKPIKARPSHLKVKMGGKMNEQ